MAHKTSRQVNFDKAYWPDGGTAIAEFPRDLMDLWEHFPDQASTFVAEALIASPPSIRVCFAEGNFVQVVSYLWDIGGDGLTVERPLAPLIDDFFRTYECVLSEEQADEVRMVMGGLQEVTWAIERAQARLLRSLKDWEARQISSGPENDETTT